jgi:hypothetical protein
MTSITARPTPCDRPLTRPRLFIHALRIQTRRGHAPPQDLSSLPLSASRPMPQSSIAHFGHCELIDLTYLGSRKDLLDRLCDLRSDTISRDERDEVVSLRRGSATFFSASQLHFISMCSIFRLPQPLVGCVLYCTRGKRDRWESKPKTHVGPLLSVEGGGDGRAGKGRGVSPGRHLSHTMSASVIPCVAVAVGWM